MSRSIRRSLVLCLKILLSAALVWWVLRKVDWGSFGQALAGIAWAPAVAGSLGSLASTGICAYRWWRLLAVQDIRVPLWEAIRLTWLGAFFNYIVLGTTGGDLVKAYYLSKHTESKTLCLTTVLVDRILGLTGLTLLSALMLSVVFAARWIMGAETYFRLEGRQEQELMRAAWVAAVMLAGLGGTGIFVFSRRLRRMLHLDRLSRWLPLAKQIATAEQALECYRRNLSSVAWAMGQTLVVHISFILGIIFLGNSLGLAIPWYQYVIHIPLIYIIAAVPIVPGGVGLAESFYWVFFSPWGNREEILALALLARLIPMFWALPGAMVAVTGPKIPSAEQIQAEIAAVEDAGGAGNS